MSKEQLTHIRSLIKQKRYDEARKRLQVMRGDPTADKWLAQLNKMAPPTSKSKFDYSGNRLDEIKAQKAQQREEQQREQGQKRAVGCAVRGCLFSVIMGVIVFLMLPMLLAAGVTSTSPEVQRTTARVFTFVSEQQENPVGRVMTNVYTGTTGQAMESIILPRSDDICNVAIERAAANGRQVSRAECQRTLEEAVACVTDEFNDAERCLRSYMMNRCLEQAGNTADGHAYCRNFVSQYMP